MIFKNSIGNRVGRALCPSLIVTAALCACVHPPREKEESPQLLWDELLLGVRPPQGAQKGEGTVSSRGNHRDASFEPEWGISDMALLSKARSHGVKDLSRYRGGYLGEAGTARYFIASKEKVPDYTRLYWVMVGVLSDKYGCFMVSRAKRGDVVTIKCRDQRRMVFWRKNGLRWVSFRVRQFDREGFEIAVRNRRIVRISEEVKVRFR